MDSNSSNILSIVSLSVSIAGIVLGVINHKKIRSNCCGTKGEISIDIENTSPSPQPFLMKKNNSMEKTNNG